MKDRILNNLADFGQDPIPPKSSYMFHSLCEQLEMEPQALRERSRRVLKEILHNYAFFDIATIDRFNHRLIRTFARDLQLPQNFEVVLETDLLLDEAVNRLLNKAGKDNRLSAILIDFALEKTEDDKSWNISNDLLKIGKLVFEENHAAELKKLEGKSLEDFLQLKELLQKNKAKAEKDLASLAQLILDSVRAEGLEDTDFTRKYFPDFMKKIASGDLNIDFKAGWKKDFGQKPLYNKSATDSVKSSIDGLMPQLERGFEQIKSTFFHRAFLTNVLKHMVPLMVLNSIRKEVEALQKERDQLPISFFNTLISEAIRDQPAPFIYERLGEKYRHYFIDEFQDTSEMQWNNLVPLISNALESKDDQGKAGSLLLVGDAKQAIYRWRGGHAEQFMQLFNKTENPFVAVPSLQEKPTNYRSCREIIRFNNDFFTQTSRILGNPVYESMYLQGNSQQYNQKDGGYVSLQFVQGTEEEHQNDIYCREVKKAIEEVKEKNYSYSDLCILTRTKAQGILLADYLIEEGIPIISSETLLLANHDPVRFLVNLLRHCLAPDEQEISYEILSFLLKDTTEKYTITKRHLDSPGRYLSESYGFDTAFLREATVYDSLEYAVGKFDLAPASDAYITYLLDEALLVEQKTDGSIVTFLEHWDKKKDKLSIVAPESMDAIQIMTVHKAKGLEFPVVLYPFASTGIYPSSGRNETLLWLAVDPGQYQGFTTLLLSQKDEMCHYSPLADQLYREEQQMQEMDAFNLLYVALTRPEQALYIFTEAPAKPKNEVKTYSDLFIYYLKSQGKWDERQTRYDFGTLDPFEGSRKITAGDPVPFVYSKKDRPELDIVTTSGMLWDTDRGLALGRGNLLHALLAEVYIPADIEPELEAMLNRGAVDPDAAEQLKELAYSIVRHPRLAAYYKEGPDIKNEMPIITENGLFLRPDRLVLQDGTAVIIDYKTGKKNPGYHEQLYTYADALEAMGYKVLHKIIVYVEETVRPEFI